MLERRRQEVLERCRGEGPANCVARCPLGVDARGYVQLALTGRNRDALQLIRRRLPFPGILGYVCSHPCELHCKRLDTDRAIRVRDIKRFLAEWEPGPPRHLVDCEADRPEKIAVVGAGPAGLIAAHDLRRLGYRVTVVEGADRLGGCLVEKIPPWRLPPAVVERDLTVIAALGIETWTGVMIGRDLALDDLRREHEVVALMPGFSGAAELLRSEPRLRADPRGVLEVDAELWTTPIEGVFAGGDAVVGPSTVVEAMAVGRLVARAIHGVLTGSPQDAGRSGLVPPPLLWELEISEVERLERAPVPLALEPSPPPMDPSEVVAEAERCLACSCSACVDECEFLHSYCSSPKELARQVGGDLSGHLRMVYSCNLCGLCRVVCPVDLDTGELLRAARREAVRRDLGPLRAHRRVRRSLRFATASSLTLAAPEPGRRHTRRVFFPGCALAASSPWVVVALYDRLRRELPGTGVILGCCGAPADALGLEHEADALALRVAEGVENLGADQILVACPECARHLRRFAPGLAVASAWAELLAAAGSPSELEIGEVTVHDPCSARGDAASRAAVRASVAHCGGVVREAEFSGERTRCCGFGGALPTLDRPLADRVARRAAAESALPIVTGCAGCYSALSRVRPDVHHVAELLLGLERLPIGRSGADSTWWGLLNRWRTRRALGRALPLGAE